MPRSPSLDRARLAKILSRLESNHDGEVLNAARAAVEMLSRAGTDWYQLLNAKPPVEPQPEITMTQEMWASGLKKYRRHNGRARPAPPEAGSPRKQRGNRLKPEDFARSADGDGGAQSMEKGKSGRLEFETFSFNKKDRSGS